MPTDKPKVSAYVPKPIKDCLIEFQKKRNISESQAVTIILAEYFGLTQTIDRTSDSAVVGGVTLNRLEKLELDLIELKEMITSLIISPSSSSLSSSLNTSIKIDQKTSDSEPVVRETQSVKQPVEKPSKAVSDKDLTDSEPTSSSQSKLLVSNEETTNLDDPLSSSLSEPLLKLLEDNAHDESQTEIPSISGGKLSVLRFGLSKDTVAGTKKQKKTPDEFTKWTRDKDPDGIGWKFVESPTKGYIPADELSSELRGKLLGWMREQGLVK